MRVIITAKNRRIIIILFKFCVEVVHSLMNQQQPVNDVLKDSIVISWTMKPLLSPPVNDVLVAQTLHQMAPQISLVVSVSLRLNAFEHFL